MAAAEHEYILKTSDAELERLGFQHRLWSTVAFEGWERARFGRGQRLLDVGSGPGYASRDMAQLVTGNGHVTAIDASARFIEHLRATIHALQLTNIEATVGDVQSVDLDENAFDGAWARWVLCFVPQPEQVVESVARALKAGGRFVVQDYFHYRGLAILPPSKLNDRVIDAVDTSWRADGGDPNVGQRLPSMLARVGLEVERIRPIVRAARPHDSLWQWPRTFFANFLPVLRQLDLITERDAEAFAHLWEEPEPDAVFFTPPMVEIIAVKR